MHWRFTPHQFSKKDPEVFQRARILWKILIFLVVASTVVGILVAYPSLKVMVFGIAAVSLVCLLVLFQGNFELSVGMMGVTLACVFNAIVFIQPYEQYYELYLMMALNIFLMMLLGFVTASRSIFVFSLLIGGSGLVADYVFRTSLEKPQVTDLVTCLILMILSGFLAIITIDNNIKALHESRKRASEGLKRLSDIKELVRTSENAFRIGQIVSTSLSHLNQVQKIVEVSALDNHGRVSTVLQNFQTVDFMVKETSRSSEKLNTIVDNSYALVSEVSSSLTQMSASVASISEVTSERRRATEILSEQSKKSSIQMELVQKDLYKLSESANDVSSFVTHIREIAAITDLLSLNASIQAARAGNMGGGFSIVAAEIRSLSRMASSHANSIADSVQSMMNSLLTMTESVRDARSGFLQVESESEALLTAMGEIDHGLKEMMEGMSQLSMGAGEVENAFSDVKNESEKLSSLARTSDGTVVELGQLLGMMVDSLEALKKEFGSIGSIVHALEREATDSEKAFSGVLNNLQNFQGQDSSEGPT